MIIANKRALARGLALAAILVLPIHSARAFDLNLQPTLMAQLDTDFHAAEPESFDGFELTRFRLGLRSRPAPWLLVVGTFQYEGGKVSPFEVYAEAIAGNSWHFSFGYRRTPLFHTAKDELIESLPIPELSLVTRALWPAEDLGAEVHYTPDTLPIEGWLRIGNGSQSVAGNDDPYPAGDLRGDLVFGTARPGQESSEWGLRVGAGGHAKYREDATGITDTTPDGFVFYHAAPTYGWQTIGEAHVAAWLGRLSATLEAGIAREERSMAATDGSGNRIGQAPVSTRGASLDVAYTIWGVPRKPGRSIVPGNFPNEQPINEDGWSGGSIEVAARLERVDLGYGAADVRPGGAEGGALAVNWWATPYTALSLAAYDDHYFLSPIEEPGQMNFWLVLARLTVSFR